MCWNHPFSQTKKETREGSGKGWDNIRKREGVGFFIKQGELGALLTTMHSDTDFLRYSFSDFYIVLYCFVLCTDFYASKFLSCQTLCTDFYASKFLSCQVSSLCINHFSQPVFVSSVNYCLQKNHCDILDLSNSYRHL